MTNDSTTTRTATVYSYDTADALEGTASPELVAESLSREDQGGVCAAYLEDGVWRYVPDSEVDHYTRHLGTVVVSVYVLTEDEDEPAPVVEVDVDSIEVHWPEDDDGREVRDPEALSHYIGVDVVIDGERVTVGCMVGAEDYQHGTIRASGAGVRPFCSAWWADASDHHDVPAGARDAVLKALDDASWDLYQRACEAVSELAELA